jgi:hypothetical protein
LTRAGFATQSFLSGRRAGLHPLHGGFFVATSAEIESLKAAALANAMSGISSATVDGRSSQAIDPLKQLEVVERLEEKAAAADAFPFPGRTFRARFGGPHS